LRLSDDMTLSNLFKKHLKLFPQKTVQVFEDGHRQTYEELDKRSNRLANGLLKLGLKKGDHVAMMAMNCLEYMEYQLATAKVGIVSVLINHFMPKERIAYMLDHSDSKAVIFENQYLDTIDYSCEKAKQLQHFIMIERDSTKQVKGFLKYEDIISQAPDTQPGVDVKITDPNTILYTTGTTGYPKAVLKSMAADMYHPICGNIYYPVSDATPKMGFPLFSHLVSLVMPPQFHLGGQSFTFMPFIFPATIIVMRTFEPEKFLSLIDREKVNSTWVLPAMLYKIQRLPSEILRKYDVSSVISIVCGSTTLKEQERKDLESFFHNARLGSNYASTEFAMVSYISGEELSVTRPDNLGFPVFSAEMKIADNEGNELAPNEVGQIWARSPGLPISCEYYKNNDATQKGFKDGWAIVGDMGWRDEKGYFYYHGRSDDIIMSGGEKISPLPIEEVIQQHPKVNAAVVIGTTDEKWQEAVTAIVVPIKSENLTEEEIINFCRSKLAAYELPKKVYFVNELPLGSTGKVDRRSLKENIGKNLQ